MSKTRRHHGRFNRAKIPESVQICILGASPICLACGMVMKTTFRIGIPPRGVEVVDGVMTAQCIQSGCPREDIEYVLPDVNAEVYEPE